MKFINKYYLILTMRKLEDGLQGINYNPEEPLKKLVREIPSLSLIIPSCYTEVLKKTKGKPMIIRRAMGLKKTLKNLPIIIRPDELIVGTFDKKIPIAVPRPQGIGLRITNELKKISKRSLIPVKVKKEDIEKWKKEIKPFWKEFTIGDYASEIAPKEFLEIFYSGSTFIPCEGGAGVSHVVPGYSRLLSKGLAEYINEAEEKIKIYTKLLSVNPANSEKIEFYKSIKIVSESLIDYAHRYSDKAKKIAKQMEDSLRKEELEKIAETCRWVPENPPRNIQEAIQFIWFIHLALNLENLEHGLSFGRLDQYLQPYYDGNRKETKCLIKNLFLKMNEIIALFDSLASLYFSGGLSGTTQAVTIGGVDSYGMDSTNEITYIILDAVKENLLPTPNLIIRRHKNMPLGIYEKILDMLSKGVNITAIVNDETVIKALARYNIPMKEIRNYGIIGCVGLTVPGSFDNTGAAFLNLAKALEITLKTENSIVAKYVHSDNGIESFYSMDDVMEAYKKNLRTIIEMVATLTNAEEVAQKKLRPTPLMSLCVDGCFEKGLDVNKGSARYNFAGIYGTGFVDVVDSLAALEKAVFKDQIVNMSDLNDALKSNFKNHEKLMHYLKFKCPKYGNDDDRADKYAQKVAEIFSEVVKGLKCTRGSDYRVGIHANCTHIGFGNLTGALPSGRTKGKPLSHDIAPIESMEGLTSSIKSITKIKHSLISNGMACTLNINPKIVIMDDGKILIALIETYFERGGLHIQFNAISPDALKEAQKSPDKYQNLIVRVSGYSAKFVELSKAVQDEIISRYCHTAN